MVLLGSTGSIGVNTLAIAKKFNIDVEVLVCGKNIGLLNKQILEHSPKVVVVGDAEDIAKVTVLKGAAAAAVWGTGAANGVIIIQTKKGKMGKTSVEVSSSIAYDKIKVDFEKQDKSISFSAIRPDLKARLMNALMADKLIRHRGSIPA